MTHGLDRRQFLGGMAAALGAFGASRPDGGDGMPEILDTHIHLWEIGRFRLRWMEAEEYRVLARDALLDEFREATRGLGPVRALYMEIDVDPEQHAAEAEFVLGLCRRPGSPLAGAVISGRPASDGFAAHLDRFRDAPEVKGVREVLTEPRTPRGYCLDPAFRRGIRLLGDRGLRFDLCVRPDELDDATRLVADCPGTAFILDHCGNPDLKSDDLSAWRRGLAAVARHPNVVCKVSGYVAYVRRPDWTTEDLAPVFDHAFECFGPDRLIYASDWPVCTLTSTYRRWVDAVRELARGRGPEFERKLFHANASRLYGLDAAR